MPGELNDYDDYDRADTIDAEDHAVIGVIANKEREALVICAPDEALDFGNDYQVFTTLSKDRIIVAVNQAMIERRAEEVRDSDGDLLGLQQELMAESMVYIVRHFAELDAG